MSLYIINKFLPPKNFLLIKILKLCLNFNTIYIVSNIFYSCFKINTKLATYLLINLILMYSIFNIQNYFT